MNTKVNMLGSLYSRTLLKSFFNNSVTNFQKLRA
jgi:hypothetical protein